MLVVLPKNPVGQDVTHVDVAESRYLDPVHVVQFVEVWEQVAQLELHAKHLLTELSA